MASLSKVQENWYLFLYLDTSGTTTGNGEPLFDFLTVINFLGGSMPLVDDDTTDELSQGTKATPITESIERVIDREPQSGSAINLIESKTYENPQFLRMKDIMSKIAK